MSLPDTRAVLDMLRKLEWSASREVYLDDFDTDPGAQLPCCPTCRGFKEVPNTIEVGDKFSGWAEVEVHEDEKEDEGHRSTCPLKEMIASLEESLAPKLVEPDFPVDEDEGNVVSLDAHRVRVEREFEDESVAYVEALWGKQTFGYNAAIRDLEALRRGEDDGSLRPPQTYHEVFHLVAHVRALANDLARHFQLEDLVRPQDDLE